MNSEINLLDRLPPVKRDLARRAAEKTPEDRAIAKRFDQDFFDGERGDWSDRIDDGGARNDRRR